MILSLAAALWQLHFC